VKIQNSDKGSLNARVILIGKNRRISMCSSLCVLELDGKRYEMEKKLKLE
jgi:hypothetical protein